jgi:hypothetical protein
VEVKKAQPHLSRHRTELVDRGPSGPRPEPIRTW